MADNDNTIEATLETPLTRADGLGFEGAIAITGTSIGIGRQGRAQAGAQRMVWRLARFTIALCRPRQIGILHLLGDLATAAVETQL